MALTYEEQQSKNIQDIRDNAAVAIDLKTEGGSAVVRLIEDWLVGEVDAILTHPMGEAALLARVYEVRGALKALEPIRDRLRAAYQTAAKRAASMQMQTK